MSTALVAPAAERADKWRLWSRLLQQQASSPSGSAWLTNAGLLLFGLVFVDLTRTGVHEWTHYVHGFSETIFGQLVLYLGGIALVERSPRNRWTLPITLVVAFGARLLAVLAPPFLSTDVYRYVWDGIVQLHGINPYRYIRQTRTSAFCVTEAFTRTSTGATTPTQSTHLPQSSYISWWRACMPLSSR